MLQQIPLTNSPNQTISQILSVDGQSLNLNFGFHYNEVAAYWAMSVKDQNNNLLVDSVPLVTGNDPACNILRQYSFLQIGSCFVINRTGSELPDYPDDSNLGTGFQVLWGDTP